MMEKRHHTTSWANKLSQVSLPDGNEAWKAMETLLDKEMPADKKKDRRRWILLLLLLLLLIGVCNCPGKGRFGFGAHTPAAQDGPRTKPAPETPTTQTAPPAAAHGFSNTPAAELKPVIAAAPPPPHTPTAAPPATLAAAPLPPPATAPVTAATPLPPHATAPVTAATHAFANTPAPELKPVTGDVPTAAPPATLAAAPPPPHAPTAAPQRPASNGTTPDVRASQQLLLSPPGQAKKHRWYKTQPLQSRVVHGHRQKQQDKIAEKSDDKRELIPGNGMPDHKNDDALVRRNGKRIHGNKGKRVPTSVDGIEEEMTSRNNATRRKTGRTPTDSSDNNTPEHEAVQLPADTANKMTQRNGGHAPADSASKSMRNKVALQIPGANPFKKHPMMDSAGRKKPRLLKEHGWVVGVGLNQFFTVGGQQSSNYNSGGITGKLNDYLPVPMVRYYINRRLYLQMEVQFNTPQYTKKNLVINYIKPDSLGPVMLTQSAAIKKLFYFNVPLSVHYNLFNKVDIGAGLQFSRLSNAIGTFDSSYASGSGPIGNNPGGGYPVDSLKQQTKSFKSDTLYRKLKTNEFRFLLDVSYSWKGFVLGVRYNQALSKFINLKIQNGQVTQSRNSSLQIYLRYILWDSRKRIKAIP